MQINKVDQHDSGSCFLQLLKNIGVNTFGSVFQSIWLKQDKDILHPQLTHEQSVIHAADGYARTTGKTGITFVTTDFLNWYCKQLIEVRNLSFHL
ncbi:thiamine pyrophosphate-binding protein [Gracilibacillus sp. D59]|uniref:thiamine pyrophosphate-binding protein n=1 Tax=Gracilibacillus sp. D59 TaxID=3457434 RepID=UPI003FCC96D0